MANFKRSDDYLIQQKKVLYSDGILKKKCYWKDLEPRGQNLESIWIDLPTTVKARERLVPFLEDIIDAKYIRYLNPKPPEFFDRILDLCTDKQNNENIIIDLFAGTGSLLLATVQKSLKDHISRNCISIQYPVPLNSFLSSTLDSNLTMMDLAKIRISRELEFITKKSQNESLSSLTFKVYYE
ncbi:MAG: hypothetical protein ACTSVL_10775 [Promethearchaeota archaeon]